MSGCCISDGRPARLFSETLTGRVLPDSVQDANNKWFKTCKTVYLQNGDNCTVDQYIICRNPDIPGATFVALVAEIWQIKGSIQDYSNSPDAILLQSCYLQRPSATYCMPHVDLTNCWSLARFQVIPSGSKCIWCDTHLSL
jgi:hypothetical protein